MLETGSTLEHPQQLLDALASRVPSYGETFMTIAEQLRDEAGREAYAKGRLEGRDEEKREAARLIARSMLQKGIDRQTVMEITGLSEDDLTGPSH